MQSYISDLEEQNAMFLQTVDALLEEVCTEIYGSLFCSQRVGTLRRFGLQCLLYVYLSYMAARLVQCIYDLLQAGWFCTCTAQAPRPSSFPVKWLGCGINKPPLSGTEFKETVELHMCSTYRYLWPVIGRIQHYFFCTSLTLQSAYCGLQQ